MRSTEVVDTGQGVTQRGRIDDQLIRKVSSVPGVSIVAGSVAGYARILDPNGKPIGVDRGSPNFGMDISDSLISVWTMRQGRVPVNGTEMAMDAGSFTEGHFTIDDQVTVISQTGQPHLHAGRVGRLRQRRLAGRLSSRPVRSEDRAGVRRRPGPGGQHLGAG